MAGMLAQMMADVSDCPWDPALDYTIGARMMKLSLVSIVIWYHSTSDDGQQLLLFGNGKNAIVKLTFSGELIGWDFGWVVGLVVGRSVGLLVG